MRWFNVSLFPVVWVFPWLPRLFESHGEWVGNYSSQFPQCSGMHLTGSHRLTYIQALWVLIDLILIYSGMDLASTHLRAERKRGWLKPLNEVKKFSASAFSLSAVTTLPVCVHQGLYTFLTFLFSLINLLSLLFFASLAKFSSLYALVFLASHLHN